MADSILSNLPQGTLPKLWLGVDASNASKKFNALDWKNVLDFSGVDPTGATSSRAGIQSAIDWTILNSARGVVWFPTGSYLLDAPLLLDNPQGIPVTSYASAGPTTVRLTVPHILGLISGNFYRIQGATGTTALNTGTHQITIINSTTVDVLAVIGGFIASDSATYIEQPAAGAHETIKLAGAGADASGFSGSFIFGNFDDFLVKRTSGLQSSSHKVLDGLNFKNDHAAGGCVLLSGCGHAVAQNCSFYGHFGLIFDQMNTSQGALNCHFSWNNAFDQSIGLCLAGTGGFAIGNDFVGIDNCVRFSLAGNIVQAGRHEVSRIGVLAGAGPQSFRILSTAASPLGGTRLTLNSTRTFGFNGLTGDLYTIANVFGTPLLAGDKHIKYIDSTHLDVPAVTWVAGDGAATISGVVTNGATGFQITSNTFEGNDYGIWVQGGSGIVCGNSILGHYQGPSGQSVVGIQLEGQGVSYIGNSAAGGFCQGAYFAGSKASSGIFQASGGSCNLCINGSYVIGNTDITINYGTGFTNPPWLVPGLIVTDNPGNPGAGAIPANTTVASLPTTTSIRLSGAGLTAPLSGTSGGSPQGSGAALSFFDPVSKFQVGIFSFVNPAGDRNTGHGLVSRISANKALSYTEYEDIELNPGGAPNTIALTINNDASFGSPGHGTVYRITQTGLGTANITAGTATVNGVTGTTVAMAVGGQYKVVHLRYVGVNTWVCHV